MPRDLSINAIVAIFEQETDEVFLVQLKIDHESLDGPIRLVHNTKNIISNGEEYFACAFRASFPASEAGTIPKCKITVDNVDRQIVQAVRSVSSDVTVTLSVVLASTPDTVEYGPLNMMLEKVTYDAFIVTGEVGPEDTLREPHPGGRITPANFPGVFQ